MRKAIEVLVGMYDGKAGFTLVYDNGEREHFLFRVELAEQLAVNIQHVCHQLRYLERQMSGAPGDQIGVSEFVNVKLSEGGDHGSSSINVAG